MSNTDFDFWNLCSISRISERGGNKAQCPRGLFICTKETISWLSAGKEVHLCLAKLLSDLLHHSWIGWGLLFDRTSLQKKTLVLFSGLCVQKWTMVLLSEVLKTLRGSGLPEPFARPIKFQRASKHWFSHWHPIGAVWPIYFVLLTFDINPNP